MKLSSAIKRARQQDSVKGLLKDGWFLCSVLAEIDPKGEISGWRFDYFNTEKDKAKTLTLSEEEAKLGKDDDMLGDPEEFHPDQAKVSPEEALKIAKEEIKTPIRKIILTNKKNSYWNVVFITKVASYIVCRINMRSGDMILKKESSLFTMVGKDPSED